MSSLEDYKKMVHAAGFNISMLINKFKKDQRDHNSLVIIPDAVFIEVCKEFLAGRDVKNSYPYFMKVLILKSHEYNANNHQKEASKYKNAKMPQNIKDIFKSL